jgi:uncharacterized Zn-finger protein
MDSMASNDIDPAPQQQHHQQSHVCSECNTSFGRLEHLKRHVATLHQARDGKAHPCEHCAKRFSRRDVLLRHFQSCRTAKDKSKQPRRPSQGRGPNDTEDNRDDNDDDENDNNASDDQNPHSQNPTRRPKRRGRYVPNAWSVLPLCVATPCLLTSFRSVNCQKRKIKVCLCF